jgi:hypothetical protein
MTYKTAAIAATLVLISAPAFAGGWGNRANANASAAALAQSQSSSYSRSSSQGGNASSATNNSNNSTANYNERRQAPGIGIPSLAAGANACLGSVSGGLSFAGFGGGLGATYLERYCESRAAADQIYRYGYRRAAIQLLLNEHPMVNRAMVMAGSARYKGKK